MNVLKFSVGDTAVLKKKHPCNGNIFRIARVGSDIKIICSTCGKDLIMPRDKFERDVKKIIFKEEQQ